MSRWSPKIFFDESSEEAIDLQIARAIAGDIQKGRLKPGAFLPTAALSRACRKAARKLLWLASSSHAEVELDDLARRLARALPAEAK